MADDQIVDFEPASPQQNFNQEEFTSFDQNIQNEVLFTPNQDQLDLESKGIEKLKNLLRVSEYSDKTELFWKRINNANSPSAIADIISVVGAKNNTILRVQSRIRKNSNKNRFKELKQKIFGAKQHNLAFAIRNNIRNKQTQSKK